MKRLRTCFMALLLPIIALQAYAADIYLAPNGSDKNDGSKEKPLATLAAALRKARELRRLNDPATANGIHIIVREGIYQQYEPVFIRPEDAGTETSATYIEAAPGERPVFSGGINIEGWKKVLTHPVGLPVAAKGKIWVADVPAIGGNVFNFRQLWVNDKKAIRARSYNGDKMGRILSWNKSSEECWIPAPKTPSLKNVETAEMLIHQWWAIANLRISKIETHGDSAKLSFHQPESKIQSEHPWPAPWISKETGNSAFNLTNALPFLDEPGEWFLDQFNRKLYYWPRAGEEMHQVQAVAPFLETLIRIEGTIDHPVTNVFFKGISFQHTGWLRPSNFGHVPHQAGMYMLEAYKLKTPGTPDKKTLENQAWVGRPAAAVAVSFATNTGFENCRFEHLASTGLDYNRATQHNRVIGNLFKDVGGTAILAGLFSDEATEIHLPYNPKDEREICSDMHIANNLITNATNEDWGCVGIGAGYVRNIIIEHNEIENISYTGITLGWGWSPTPNVMRNNKIHANKIHHYGKHNYDCAGIYTLSAQPGSVISENYIDSIYKAPYAHLPSHWFYLYTDEGSSYFTVKDNWTPSEKYLQNANGPGNVWTNNGPQVALSIKQNAGIEKGFQGLLNEKSKNLDKRPINEEKYSIVEVVAPMGQTIDREKLKAVLAQNRLDTAAVYQWNNHYVLFGKVADVLVLQGRLQKNFPQTTVKVYHDLFYEFNRKLCANKNTATQWDHILLTADLVVDEKLQKEYMTYHATQFKKWPEVSKGFCNADFQQLLLYRNGRQLMLVISIPKGASLDKLNPKTTENNPRVDEWNRIMKKYQQGIEGTKEGETWVFLKPLF